MIQTFCIKALVFYETNGGHGEHDAIEEAIRAAIESLPIKPRVEIMEATDEEAGLVKEEVAAGEADFSTIFGEPKNTPVFKGEN